MDSKKISLLLKKIIPMLLVFGIISACENDRQEVATLIKKKLPTSIGKNVELIYSEDANVQVKMTAPLMEEYIGENGYKEMKKGIKVIFYDSLMNVTSTLTSNYAIQREGERKMEAKDDVVVVNEKGERLNTNHLIWLKDSAMIYSEDSVTITTDNEIMTGQGMEATQDFKNWKIFKPTGVINVSEEPDSPNKEK